MRLYDCTAMYPTARECALMLGDNTDSGGLNPWESALRIVLLQGVDTDEEVHREVERLYTIRLATFPQDKHIVESMVSEQSRSLETPPLELSGQILLACNILVDGRESDASHLERLARAPEEVRRLTSCATTNECCCDGKV